MVFRYFELTENVPSEENRELHNRFILHLKHVVGVSYMPGTNGKHVIVNDEQSRSIAEIFGGDNEEFLILYHIDEYQKI